MASPITMHRRVLTASLVGTAVEFYDFYVYATAAALVFGELFFPQESSAAQQMFAFMSFGLAFVARPVAVFLCTWPFEFSFREKVFISWVGLRGSVSVLCGAPYGYRYIRKHEGGGQACYQVVPDQARIVKQIFEIIKELNQKDGMTVFLVEQNAYHALKLAHRGYVMVTGNITMSGTGKELLEDPQVRAAYLEGGHH